MSQASGTDDAEAHTHNDEQSHPRNDTVGPIEEEKTNDEPSAELPSGISNPGPSQPLGPYVQESTSKVAPVGDLALEAEKAVLEKDQPTLGELAGIMKQVLGVLQDSTIASKSGKDARSRFWGVYKRVAEEHDSEFLERYTSDMDIVLVFSGLFSAVSTSFIVAMESTLSFDPSDTTNALLVQLVQIGLGNLATASSAPVPLASTWSPPTMTIWIQIIAYASLSMSLLAAFGAVLGKQWLGYYKSNRYGRGSQEERGKRRQEMFDGIVTWYFDAVVQSFPVLLQISLLLFGIALGANIWTEQPSIAWVIIATTVFGFLFYSLTVMACLISPSCPFQTPISTILRMLKIDRVLRLVLKPVFGLLQHFTSVYNVLQRLLGIIRRRWNRLAESLRGSVCAAGTFARRSLQPLCTTLHNGLHSFIQHSPKRVVDSEAQSSDQDTGVLAENGCTLALGFPDKSTSNLEAPSVKWLLETFTDPEVFLAAASLVPQVDWPLDLEVSDLLHQLYDVLMSCVGFHGQIVPSLEEKASACTMALRHLHCGRVLQAYSGHGEFLGRGRGDHQAFLQMELWCMGVDNARVLATAMKLCLPDDGNEGLLSWFPSYLYGCPDSFPEWLSHSLPYHFVTGHVNEAVENLAIAVLSKLLSPPSSPSNQIIANCTFLTCVMIGVQFDKRDVARVDKSSALPRLTESLLTHFQKALWACGDGGDLEKDSTGIAPRAWRLLDVICLMLEPAKRYYSPSVHIMRNLDTCRKIYSRVKSSEEQYPWASLNALLHALRFALTAGQLPRDPVQVWYNQYLPAADSHSPEDFDWLVDYLDYVYSYDKEVAYDILLLLDVMKVCCSPAKQYQFIESLILCMHSNMPSHLRHVALRAAHRAREVIASIDVVDDAELRDRILTKFPPAILTAVCPQPGAPPNEDDPDRFFNADRDLCYLGLVFTLAGNSHWHPYLSGDHISRCISMIAEYNFTSHLFYLAGILLRITPEQLSVLLLDSITGQQWWDLMRGAWLHADCIIDDKQCFEFLPILVEGTKRYIQIASKNDLEDFIGDVNMVLDALEGRDSKQGERDGVAVAVKGLRSVVNDMLEKLVNSEGVIGP